ncbi:MAG: hypothetical protein HY980_03390, partial [Candidatus Magasanikbacteria bacterium]|nr:hypothetical protein [Candidatus Magasanikbacteria bacterium]
MFDDQMQNNSASTPPGNLPVGEPDDMFADVDKSGAINPAPVDAGEPAIPAPHSALSAGILRPKQPETPAVDYSVPPRQPSPAPMATNQPQEIYKIKEPALTRGLITIIIILVVVAILGGGGWWIYNSFIKTDNSLNLGTESEAPLIKTEEAVVAPDEEEPLATGGEEEAVSPGFEPSEAAVDVLDEQVLFGEPVDKDGDNLDDLKEAELGTDPANWDTDNDGLGDGDEILIWQTDPLNPDTDGDSYLDGAEVKNGYRPNGPGKIFEPTQ